MIRLRSARSWLPICCPASCWCFEARSRYLHARARDGAARWIGGTGNRVNRAQSGAIGRNQAQSGALVGRVDADAGRDEGACAEHRKDGLLPPRRVRRDQKGIRRE